MKNLDPIETRLLAGMERKVDEMVRMYNAGRSTGVIAEEVGFSRSTVRRYLKQRGVTLGCRGAPRQIQGGVVEIAKAMRGNEKTWDQIEKKTGFSARQLQRWLYGK